ncbi:FMN-dependent L-lactate dehydrogenase LldD [Sphingomonas alba]|uniref:FMN-dependent L-lactate dehydrogenase LldD n=1 Tax=Sphingomonas alba TaxID=2908208 RepID=A0ABT0RLT3_9SPHN|nr:FMN-dependent L-lactate dehydrogenase LldD [Sphingomonas alba]MCL6683607.1 FMN-dependent L-lactate dehydrogenase LldD [Sphingomonas alba]
MAKGAASVSDFRALAKARLPHFLFEYIDGGSYDEVTLDRNVEDLRAIALKQRVMRDVSELDLSTLLFGHTWDLPVGLGPVGMSGMYARRGEVQAARAATAAGVPFSLSTLSVCSIREVARELARPFWLQLYMVKDRAFLEDLLQIGRDSGCSALLLTVDLPVSGSRYRDVRSGLAVPASGGASFRRFCQSALRPGWAWDVGLNGRPHGLGNLEPVLGKNSGLEDYFGWIAKNFDPSITWADLAWVRQRWEGPIIIKGILDPEDAHAAVSHGADGIVVSNHGGRQLDGALSSAKALPRIADAVAGRIPILVDGGVRSGLDVVRMLALGADFVLMGRAWAYALAADGERGVAHMLKLVEAEIRAAMALTGCRSIREIDRAILAE